MLVSVADIFAAVKTTRAKQLAWIEAVLAYRRWTQTELSRRANISPSTLSKFIAEVIPGSNLSANTVAAIERVGGIPAYDTVPPAIPRGFTEIEAMAKPREEADPIRDAIGNIVAGWEKTSAWVMQSRALEVAGYLPGDVLIVDANAIPELGDVVCVQLVGHKGQAETAFRIYEAPYLVASSYDPDLRRPTLIDNDRAIITGVVVAQFRPRATRH